MARCMLADSRLPLYFWSEAVAYAVYLKNRIQCSPLKGKTPFEVFHNSLPFVPKHVYVFGKPVLYVDNTYKTKFSPRTKEGIFLGIGEIDNQYIIFDIESNELIRSRDVIFNFKGENVERILNKICEKYFYF